MHLALGGAMADANRTMADPLFFSQQYVDGTIAIGC